MIEIKQPGDTLVFAFDFTGQTGGAPVTVQSTSVTARGWASGPALVVQDAQADGSVVRVKVTGGTSGETYLIKIVALNTGDPVEGEIECQVMALGFVLPEGAQAYCDPRSYVARFGYEETVRFTDERGLGRIDGDKLSKALGDAMAMVDSYLAGKYAVPLAAPVPPLVQTFTAMLARSLLAIHESDEHAAKKAATLALRQLSDIRDGKNILSGAVATDVIAPADVQQNEVLVTAQERMFSDTSLTGF
jgi:phage gp36-like protein